MFIYLHSRCTIKEQQETFIPCNKTGLEHENERPQSMADLPIFLFLRLFSLENPLDFYTLSFDSFQLQQHNGVDGNWRPADGDAPANSAGTPAACSECKLLRQWVNFDNFCLIHSFIPTYIFPRLEREFSLDFVQFLEAHCSFSSRRIASQIIRTAMAFRTFSASRFVALHSIRAGGVRSKMPDFQGRIGLAHRWRGTRRFINNSLRAVVRRSAYYAW